jgi:hypothetical protein
MKIYILATKQRSAITEYSVEYWRSIGWQPIVEYNDDQLPAIGRNRILKKFYDSLDPWLALADDDITLWNDKCKNFSEFISDPISVLEKTPDYISTVVPINPYSFRVTSTHLDPIYNTHWRYDRDFVIPGKITFHRNTGFKFFQLTHLPALEDQEWAFQQLKAGFITARLNNIVLREKGKSMLFADNKHRQNTYNQAKQELINLYPELYIDQRNYFVRTRLIKKYLTPKSLKKTLDIIY